MLTAEQRRRARELWIKPQRTLDEIRELEEFGRVDGYEAAVIRRQVEQEQWLAQQQQQQQEHERARAEREKHVQDEARAKEEAKKAAARSAYLAMGGDERAFDAVYAQQRARELLDADAQARRVAAHRTQSEF